MKTLQSALLLLVCVFCSNPPFIFAQDFVSAYDRFSSSATMYITLADETKLEGTLDDLKRKKNQVELVSIKLSNGEVKKMKPEEIKNMYLKPSAYAKTMTDVDAATKVQTWDNSYINSELVKEGYCYFEQAKVALKNETPTLLLQLLNPGYSSKIKVFYDPYAQETGGFGIGDLKLTGGDDKSYYVQVGNNVATKTKKKDYETAYRNFYADCPDLIKKIEKDVKWSDFAKHIYAYSFDCK